MSTIGRRSAPPASAPEPRRRPRGTPASPSAGDAVGLHPAHETGRDHEKFGLVEATFARERYASVLEIGCGRGEFAALLVERCGRYTGMDIDPDALAAARRRVNGDVSARFVPLSLPIALPSGGHELVVLTHMLQLLEPGAVRELAGALAAHAPCREILVVGSRDDGDGARDPTLAAFVTACGDAFVHEELAVRRRYRVDALLR